MVRELPLCILVVIAIVFAQHDVINQKIRDCINNTLTDGNMTVAYLSIDPFYFKSLEPFDVKTFNYTEQLEHDPDIFSNASIRAACICTNIPLNSKKLIVNPVLIDGLYSDAMTLCVFHDTMNDVFDVLDIPRGMMQGYLMGQLTTFMPRGLFAEVEKPTPDDCVDINGHPTTQILGQITCYYMNHVKLESTESGITVKRNSYYGPFLGTQFPNFTDFALFSGATMSLDFAPVFDALQCSLLKSNSSLSPGMIKTGCTQRFFTKNSDYLGYMSCCCLGRNDPNCREVASAIKEKKIMCLNGTLNGNVSMYFAKQCHYTVTKNHRRTTLSRRPDPLSFEHLQGVTSKIAQISFDNHTGCHSTATTCEKKNVDVIESGCCKAKDFCSAYNGMRIAERRCYWSYGEKYDGGCYVIFYRADGQWHLSSSLWFNMKKSKLIHLYSSRISNTNYKVSLGLLEEKAMTTSCSEKKKHEATTYYVIHCALRDCDRYFRTNFFNQLDKKLIFDSVQKARIPRCENGSWTATTDALSKEPLVPKPNTTRVVGQYCIFRLSIEYFDDNEEFSLTFGPVFPKPKDCNTHHKDVDGRFIFTCCYEASHNASYIHPSCHYSTILSIVDALEQNDNDDEGTVPQDNVEPPASIRQRVGENADYCESSGAVGYHGRPSRRCTPGGKGCFHVNGLEDPKEAVIASCIGRGEELMATSKDAFDRYHEALICLTDEAKGQCHAVHDGTRWRKICCCEISTERKHVGRCKEDSKLLFNENQYVAKRVSEFKDDDGDDDGDDDDKE